MSPGEMLDFSPCTRQQIHCWKTCMHLQSEETKKAWNELANSKVRFMYIMTN